MPCILTHIGWSNPVSCCPANSFSYGDVMFCMQCNVFRSFSNVSALYMSYIIIESSKCIILLCCGVVLLSIAFTAVCKALCLLNL